MGQHFLGLLIMVMLQLLLLQAASELSALASLPAEGTNATRQPELKPEHQPTDHEVVVKSWTHLMSPARIGQGSIAVSDARVLTPGAEIIIDFDRADLAEENQILAVSQWASESFLETSSDSPG